jgi:Transposase DDE domain group 1
MGSSRTHVRSVVALRTSTPLTNGKQGRGPGVPPLHAFLRDRRHALGKNDDNYCYLPLYVFCGRHLLLARQRRPNVAGSDGAVAEMARIVAQIRRKWPRVRIVLRGDSGFSTDPLMRWCEANRVDYVFGLARNSRLEVALAQQTT